MSVTMEQLLERLEALESENKKLKSNKKGSSKEKAPTITTTVEIGSNFISGIQLMSPSGDIDIEIRYGDIVSLPFDDVVQIVKGSTNRNMFVDGLLYFIDDGVYESLGLRRKHNINKDAIKELVTTNNHEKIKEFLDDVTRNKLNHSVVHTVFYTIVILAIEGELDAMRYDTRKFIEGYFNSMEIEMAGKLYTAFKNIKG